MTTTVTEILDQSERLWKSWFQLRHERIWLPLHAHPLLYDHGITESVSRYPDALQLMERAEAIIVHHSTEHPSMWRLWALPEDQGQPDDHLQPAR